MPQPTVEMNGGKYLFINLTIQRYEKQQKTPGLNAPDHRFNGVNKHTWLRIGRLRGRRFIT
jgi:hypothetical protein